MKSIMSIFSTIVISCCAYSCSQDYSRHWTVSVHLYGDGTVTIIDGFSKPYGICAEHGNHLYVADLGEGRVIRFSEEFAFDGWLGLLCCNSDSVSGWHYNGFPVQGDGEGQLNMPHSVDFSPAGDIFVSDYRGRRIHRYSVDGEFLGRFFDSPDPPELAFAGPANAHFDSSGRLWISDFDGNRVYLFDASGAFSGWLGEPGSGVFHFSGSATMSSVPGGFNKPHMARTDSDGNIYVVESGNNRVQKLSPSGAFIGWIGALSGGGTTDGWAIGGTASASADPGGFNQPLSLQLCGDGSMIVTDNGNNRIQKFGADGRFISWLGGRAEGGTTSGWAAAGQAAAGDVPGAFDAPFDAVEFDGKLYVADGHNGRVQIFDLN
jgi:DNA-binding beta-propeller fold protein YncE